MHAIEPVLTNSAERRAWLFLGSSSQIPKERPRGQALEGAGRTWTALRGLAAPTFVSSVERTPSLPFKFSDSQERECRAPVHPGPPLHRVQTHSHGWGAAIPVSVLSDFCWLWVWKCRWIHGGVVQCGGRVKGRVYRSQEAWPQKQETLKRG